MDRLHQSTFNSELIGGHAALDLVNTVSWRLDNERRRDNLRDFPALAEWCRRAGLIDNALTQDLLAAASAHPRISQQVLHDSRALRDHLHELLASLVDDGEPADPVAVPPCLRVPFLEALAHSDLIGPTMRWQLTPQRLADLPRLLALQAIDLLQTSELHMIRRCHGAGCGWLFLDRTRSHTRRWCSSSDCGNRDRARRHYARHLDQTSHEPGTSVQ
jgi:predicted RNA-binding Zn ribbon-like protein